MSATHRRSRQFELREIPPVRALLLTLSVGIVGLLPLECRAGDSTGYLSFDSVPWTKVFENGEFLASTPIFKRRIESGTHTFKLLNEGEKVEKLVTVVVPAGQTLAVRVVANTESAGVETSVVPPARTRAEQANDSPGELLIHAQQAYAGLRFDEAIADARALIGRADTTQEQQLEGFRIWGSAAAVSMDPVDAELPFRMLMRARPEFELASDLSPKILSVFRKVQLEEQSLARRARDAERERIVAGLRLLSEVPETATGGRAFEFRVEVGDPTNAVQSVQASYRRQGETPYSTLQLARTEKNLWRNELAAQMTASDDAFHLEYFVEAVGADGPLVALGSAEYPNRVEFAAGQPPHGNSRKIPRWVFFTTVGATAAAGAVSLITGAAGTSTLNQLNLSAFPTLITAQQASDLASQGNALMAASSIAAIVAISGLISSGVEAFFTDWSWE